MLQEITFSPATLLLLVPIVAWLIWAIRRLTRRGLCDCHGDGKKKSAAKGCAQGGCAHCAAACPASEMAAHLDELSATPKSTP